MTVHQNMKALRIQASGRGLLATAKRYAIVGGVKCCDEAVSLPGAQPCVRHLHSANGPRFLVGLC